MTNATLLLLAIIGFIAYTLYTRHRHQQLLREVVRGFQLLVQRDAIPNPINAEKFSQFITAILDAEASVRNQHVGSQDSSGLTRVRLLQATHEDVLNAIGLHTDPGHRYECYKALMALAGRYDKLQRAADARAA
jgi:hypothetical protein